MKTLLLFIFLLGISLSYSQQRVGTPDATSDLWENIDETGIQQINELVGQLSAAMDRLPPTVDRMAISELKVDKQEFSLGMSRFIRHQVESVFDRVGKKSVVSVPELRASQIVMTDSSFSLTKSIPDAEALWTLGRKLRLDAFLEGSVTRSPVGDVLLSLKLIKQETAEIIWAETFIAGPNKPKKTRQGLEFGVVAGLSIWPMDNFENGTIISSENLNFYKYYTELEVSEISNESKSIYVSYAIGAGLLSPVVDNPKDTLLSENISTHFEMRIGGDIHWIIKPKKDPSDGYDLALYTGLRATWNDFFTGNKFIIAQGGLAWRPTPHLALEIGANVFPLTSYMNARLTGSSIVNMGKVSYDTRIHYYF